jgi:hypothetical protein
MSAHDRKLEPWRSGVWEAVVIDTFRFDTGLQYVNKYFRAFMH